VKRGKGKSVDTQVLLDRRVGLFCSGETVKYGGRRGDYERKKGEKRWVNLTSGEGGKLGFGRGGGGGGDA